MITSLKVHSKSATLVYLLGFNQGTVPIDTTAVDEVPVPLVPGASGGQYYESKDPIRFTDGFVLVGSSTAATLTQIVADDLKIEATLG